METQPDPSADKKKKRKKKIIFRKDTDLDDNHLAEKSNTWQALFLDHTAQFAAFDPDFGGTFATDWEGKIEAFEDFPTDETMVDTIQVRDAVLQAEMKTLMGLMSDLEYYARKAFPDDKPTFNEFGFKKIKRTALTANAGYTALLCYTAILIAADYNSELTTAGMPALLPGNINSQKDAVAEAWTQVEYANRLRSRAATLRIKKFNELWAIHQRVKKAAARIFSDNEVVARQFE